MAYWVAGRVPTDDGDLGGLAVPEDVQRHRVPGRVLAHHHVERVGRVEGGAVDRGDDVAGLEPACRPGRRRRPSPGQCRRWPWPPWLARRCRRDPGTVVDRQAVGLLDGRVDGLEPDAETRAGQRLAGGRLGEQRAAMSIGMAKPMPWLSPATAVLMPMTLPLGSSSGPPLLPGLIAVSVWMRFVRTLAALDGDAPAEGRDDPARDGVGERAERAADGDRLLADLDGRRVADRGGREAGRVDLDDGEVGERVDAVDRGVEGAAVLEVDRERWRVAGDDVVVGEDQAVGVEDDAGAGGRPVPVWPVVGSVAVTPSATIVTTAGLTALTMSTTGCLTGGDGDLGLRAGRGARDRGAAPR